MTTITETLITETFAEQRSTQKLPIITIRAIRPDDIDLICAMHQRLSAESVYFRYLQSRIPVLDELEAVCQMTLEKGAAMVATINTGNNGREDERIVALAYYICDAVKSPADENLPSAEIAILVEDQFQGQGVGRLLWQALHQHAQNERLHSLRVLFDPANYRLLRLIKGSGYPYRASAEGDLNDFQILLAERPQPLKVQQLLERFGLPTLKQLFHHQSARRKRDAAMMSPPCDDGVTRSK